MSNRPPLLRICDFAHPSVDDRGEPVRLASRRAFERQFQPKSIRAQRFKLRTTFASKCERPEPRYIGCSLSTLVSLSMLGLILLAAMLIWLTPIESGIVVLATFILFLSTAVVHSHYRHRGTTNIVAMSALAEGLCASCAFSLQGLGPDDDGCLVCPECGHAWDALRIVRPHWEPPPENLIPKRDPRLDLRHNLKLLYVTRFASDDCGRLVRTHTSYLWGLDPSVRAQRPDEDWKRLTRHIRSFGRPMRTLISTLFFMLVIFGLVRWSFPAYWDDIGEFVTSIITLSFPFFAGVFVYAGDGWVRNRRMAHALAQNGLCAGCCNDLTRTPANANAMRVCDRCRSSWLDERFPPDPGEGATSTQPTP